MFQKIGTRLFDIHMIQNVIAYESGNGILLWDLEIDKKVKLHNHDSQVQAVLFGGSLDDKYVISLDGQFKVSIFISEWDTLRKVHYIYIPQKNRKKPVKSVLASYDRKNNLILVIENEDEGGNRLSVWEFKNEKLTLQFISDIDNNSCALFMDCFNFIDQNHKITTQIAIAEQQCIKYFKIVQSNQVILTNRVHLKENIINMCVNATYNIVIVLLHSGKIILIDSMGELVSQIKHPTIIFSCISSIENTIFCGGNNGFIYVYDLSTSKLLTEIPYDQSIRKNSSIEIQLQDEILNSSHQQRKSLGNTSEYKVRNNEKKQQIYGPAVCSLKNSSDGNLLVIVYSDGTSIVMDVKYQQILHKLIGHAGRINQIVWDKQNKKKFFAVGDDGFLSLWDFNGDRWLPKMIDLSQTIDKSLNSFSKTNQQILSEYHLKEKQNDLQQSKSLYKHLQVKTICLNSSKDEIYCGDNKGNLYIFNSTNGRYIQKHNLSGFKISSMSLSPGCKYLCVFLVTGLTLLFDTTDRFSLKIKLEDAQEKQLHQINPGVLLIEDQLNTKQGSKESSSLNTINNFDKSFVSLLQGSSNVSKQYHLSNKSDNQFLAITIHAQNSLRLHSIQQTSQSNMNSIVVANFPVEGTFNIILRQDYLQITKLTKGLISSFIVHPSNQYVLILSNVGYVYIFNLKSSELRGKIDIPKYSQKIQGRQIFIIQEFQYNFKQKINNYSKNTEITIDPSGLYFAISAYSNLSEENENYLSANAFNSTINSIMRTDKSTLTIYNPHKEVDLFFKKKPNVKPVRIILYEIGTGNFVGEIPSLFNIESFSISEEGKFISIGSTSGIISVWATCKEVRENIFEVLDQMRIKEDFWRDYPIYLEPENMSEQNNFDDDHQQRKDDESQNLDLSVKSIQIGKNQYQKQGVQNTGRYSLKDKEASRIFDPQPQTLKKQNEQHNQIDYQKARSMNFYDTQNKLQISSVGGTQNNLQYKFDRNQNESNNNKDRFYRSKNDVQANQKQFYTPQKDNINIPQESIKANLQRSSLTQEKLRELNFQNSQLEKQNVRNFNESNETRNIPKLTNIDTLQQQQISYPQNQHQISQQQQNHNQNQHNPHQNQQRKSLGDPQYNQQPQQVNYKQNPREQFEEPMDIDDDVQSMPNTQIQQNIQNSPGQIGWRQQQQLNQQQQQQDQQFRKPLNNNIRNSQEFEIPSPSSIKQSQRSDSQFDSIERFETKLKNNKIQQSQFQQYN